MQPQQPDMASSSLRQPPLLHLPDYENGFPICVDLDGTLIREHSIWCFHWSLASLLSAWCPRDFRSLRPTGIWPGIKTRMAAAVNLAQATMTYHAGLLSQIHHWHALGSPLYLVTGAPQKMADQVAQTLGVVTEVWSSSAHHNLVGQKKADLLRHRFGAFGYTYIGDSWKDRPVWACSKDILAVTDPQGSLGQYLQKNALPQQGLFFLPHGTQDT